MDNRQNNIEQYLKVYGFVINKSDLFMNFYLKKNKNVIIINAKRLWISNRF